MGVEPTRQAGKWEECRSGAALVKSPKLNEVPPPYTVGITYHVSLEFSVCNSLLHCARGDSKYLCAVAHF